MTIEDIKKEALKLMFTNQDDDIDTMTIDELLTDENYSDYLVNMYGSINRAIVRLKSKGVLYNGDRLTKDTPNSTILEIDENLLEAIPYFIKGELYEEDSPQQASIAKNYFEDMVDEYLSTLDDRRVDTIYEMDVEL